MRREGEVMSLFKKKPRPPSNDPERPPKGPACDVYSKPDPEVIVVIVKEEK